MLESEPSNEVVEWYSQRKESLAKSKGTNRTYYWNFSREHKLKFVELLSEQYQVEEPEFEFNMKKLAQIDSDARSAYIGGKIYCSAKATHGKLLLKLFYQHVLAKKQGLDRDNYPDLLQYSERFAAAYWDNLTRAAKATAPIPFPLY